MGGLIGIFVRTLVGWLVPCWLVDDEKKEKRIVDVRSSARYCYATLIGLSRYAMGAARLLYASQT